MCFWFWSSVWQNVSSPKNEIINADRLCGIAPTCLSCLSTVCVWCGSFGFVLDCVSFLSFFFNQKWKIWSLGYDISLQSNTFFSLLFDSVVIGFVLLFLAVRYMEIYPLILWPSEIRLKTLVVEIVWFHSLQVMQWFATHLQRCWLAINSCRMAIFILCCWIEYGCVCIHI